MVPRERSRKQKYELTTDHTNDTNWERRGGRRGERRGAGDFGPHRAGPREEFHPAETLPEMPLAAILPGHEKEPGIIPRSRLRRGITLDSYNE